MPALDLIIGPNFIFALAKRRNIVYNIFRTRRCDGIGRRSGLKIRRWRQRGGPSPPTGTKTKDRFGGLLFWVPLPLVAPPFGIMMLGRVKPTLRNSPLRSEFTAQKRCGPEGPYQNWALAPT